MVAIKPLLVIVGPTASGKSELSMKIVVKIPSVIICADSRTVYKGLDIGTAKPTLSDRQKVTHFGLDMCSPNEVFTAADFQKLANKAVSYANSNNLLPIIVGGTGLYIDGYILSFKFGPMSDDKKRTELEKLSITELQQELNGLGLPLPENYKNKRHLIRTIEQMGINKSKSKLPSGTIMIGINPSKERLELRIRNRAKTMVKSGVIEETKELISKYGKDCPAASGNIYRALIPYLEGEISLDSAIDDFIQLDKKLVKKQLTWFKRNKHIKWYENPKNAFEEIFKHLIKFAE